MQLVMAAMAMSPSRRVPVCSGRAPRPAMLDHCLVERGGDLRQRLRLMGAPGPGHHRFDGAEVDVEDPGEGRFGRSGGPEHALGPAVPLDQVDVVGPPAGEAEVAERLVVDREVADGGAVLGRHVGDGGPIGQREGIHPRTAELHEGAHHTEGPQPPGDGQHQVGAGDSGARGSGQPDPDDLGNDHTDRLAQHHRFGLDAPDAPAEDSHGVDHGGVGVGADEGVGMGDRPGTGAGHRHHRRQELHVDLVDDPLAGRDDPQVGEGLLGPPGEPVPLGVALVLDGKVDRERIRGAGHVHLQRVVHDQVGGNDRIDHGSVTAAAVQGAAHGGQPDQRRDAGEVLQDEAVGTERHRPSWLDGARPSGQGGNIGLGGESRFCSAQ